MKYNEYLEGRLGMNVTVKNNHHIELNRYDVVADPV